MGEVPDETRELWYEALKNVTNEGGGIDDEGEEEERVFRAAACVQALQNIGLRVDNDGLETAAHELSRAMETVNPELARDLSTAVPEERYSEELFVDKSYLTYIGKTR